LKERVHNKHRKVEKFSSWRECNAYNILFGNLKGKDHSEDLGVEGKGKFVPVLT